jgi:UDP-2,3-diacylglucosamine hydrolase
MNEAVFIADLHLHPQAKDSERYFQQWLVWAKKNTQAVYILGDFFHAWAGDDTLDAWSIGIVNQLQQLVAHGIAVYFMPGNRDFLLGEQFRRQTGICYLSEPTVVQLGEQRVLLVHGDGYCLDDKAHQRFRRLTRAPWFSRLFLALPRRVRQALVKRVRHYSQSRPPLAINTPGICIQALAADALRHHATVIIHGHIHQPGLTTHAVSGHVLQQFVLSDWDASPSILCYNSTNHLYYTQLTFEE